MTIPRPLKAGDKVMLKEGGRQMTVTLAVVHMAYCFWQDGPDKRHALFRQDDLELVEDPSDAPLFKR